jgi:predicted Kef-type K+ transport protein
MGARFFVWWTVGFVLAVAVAYGAQHLFGMSDESAFLLAMLLGGTIPISLAFTMGDR